MACAGVVRVRDDGEGFHVRLVRDPRIEEVFEGGIVCCGEVLYPVPRNQLDDKQRQVLLRGLRYGSDEVAPPDKTTSRCRIRSPLGMIAATTRQTSSRGAPATTRLSPWR